MCRGERRGGSVQQRLEKQSKAKQSKAKQSKANCNRVDEGNGGHNTGASGSRK